MAIVPVSTTPLILRHLYPIPYYTPQAPQYFIGIKGMLGTALLQWSQFNMESTQETYLLTQGPRRDSQFDMGLFSNLSSQEYLLPNDEEEEDDVEQCLDALKRAQRKFHRDLEEVIRAIPDMVVQALQVERDARLAPDQGAQQQTDHMLLTDQGAFAFARAMGFPEVPGEKLITERSLSRWKKNLEADWNPQEFQKDLGTVGAVAIDSAGNVACATSTGGLTNKMIGRVGDTACIGSGGYADNNVGATSTTGHGESIMKVVLARLVLYHMEQGKI
ncbi:UNVERIFIED_CONTAM: hypothetical protein K2H54_007973 [Gekko kuhli]